MDKIQQPTLYFLLFPCYFYVSPISANRRNGGTYAQLAQDVTRKVFVGGLETAAALASHAEPDRSRRQPQKEQRTTQVVCWARRKAAKGRCQMKHFRLSAPPFALPALNPIFGFRAGGNSEQVEE